MKASSCQFYLVFLSKVAKYKHFQFLDTIILFQKFIKITNHMTLEKQTLLSIPLYGSKLGIRS